MEPNVVFNITVCLVGILFLLIHTTDLLLKKGRRNDENNLLIFIVFTAIHFATYLTFSLVKINYTSDAFIIGFYTTFYVMNNIEVLLLFLYTMSYIVLDKKIKDIFFIINISLFAAFVSLDIANIFSHLFFYAEGGIYMRSQLMIISQGYQFIAFAIVFVLTLINKKLNLTEKIAFSFYCILPLVAIILQNRFAGYAIAYLSIIVSIEVLFLFVNVKKNIQLANEAKRSKEAEVKLMMSQIQPHFIYNALSSISTLIKIDPDKAQKGLDDFTEYLRANLASISNSELIPFEDELKHIETYLSLEKMRFEDRLQIELDIKDKDFKVPPLCIQPLVENGVKHGILKKLEGGTITIRTYKKDDTHVVEIIDDGVGFKPGDMSDDGTHIGLANIKSRLSSMCNAELFITSEIDKGTTVVVKFN